MGVSSDYKRIDGPKDSAILELAAGFGLHRATERGQGKRKKANGGLVGSSKPQGAFRFCGTLWLHIYFLPLHKVNGENACMDIAALGLLCSQALLACRA